MAYQVLQPHYRTEECLKEIKECFDKSWTGLGYKTLLFEEEWKNYTKLPYAHFLNSATAGLHLAVKILKDEYKWNDGDEIITTPFTFVSTNHAIKYENLVPRFADIDYSLTINPSSVKRLINNRTKAIVFVGLGGNIGNLVEITNIARENRLPLILDAAHMAGTRFSNGVHVGASSDVSIFSFQAVKNLPIADAGMICFSNDDFDIKARKLSWLGINKDTFSRTNKETYKWKYDVEDIGFKYHGNSIMAAIGLVGLKYLDNDNNYRRVLSSIYDEIFKTVPKNVFRISHNNCLSSRHLYQILVKDRDNLINKLNSLDIYPGVHYISNTNYKMYSYDHKICPVANYISDHILSLPLHINLLATDITKIGKTIKEILNEKTNI